MIQDCIILENKPENNPKFAEFLEVSGKNKKFKPSWCDHAAELEEDENLDSSDTPPHRPMSAMEKKEFCEMFTVKVKKLPYSCKQKHLKAFFLPLKPASIRIPRGHKGIAYIGFTVEKDMKKALNKNRGFLEGRRVDVIMYHKKAERNISEKKVKEVENQDASELIAEGRLLHVIPGNAKKEMLLDPKEMTFKQRKAAKEKSLAHSSHNWNTLFLGFDAVADVMAEKYNVSKEYLLLGDETRDKAVVRMALGETQLVMETRQFLIRHGVDLDAFSQPASEHSKTVIIVKHLRAKTTSEQLLALFSKYGSVNRVILPESCLTALVEFHDATEAKTAFSRLAYSRFVDKPLYLEWAPMRVFTAEPPKEGNPVEGNDTECQSSEGKEVCDKTDDVVKCKNAEATAATEEEETEEEDDVPQEGTTLFIKNLNFETSEESLKAHFETCGPLHSVSVSKKKDMKSGKLLSMGFGFVHFKQKSSAQTAMQDLQLSVLDGHTLQLKFSNKATQPVASTKRKRSKVISQKTSKICVRNIPFQAKVKEVKKLFEPFGELKFVRLPKKSDSAGQHRGFGFVDFVHKNCAKRAFEALCHSTHLLGRRLVLEWANTESEDVDYLRKKTAKEYNQR